MIKIIFRNIFQLFKTYNRKRRQLLRKPQLWGSIIFILLLSLPCYYMVVIHIPNVFIAGRNCFADRYFGKELKSFKFEDILLSERKPTIGKSLFFLETSCTRTGKLELNARQACAIESAALQNPNLDIFVLFASPTGLSNETLPEFEFNPGEILTTYRNIFFRNVNLWSYAADTPLADWIKNDDQLFKSIFISSHMSDFLRYLTLWRWGGTYLDLDIILKKSLENIKPNFAGAESEYFIAAGVVNIGNDKSGRHIAGLFLKNFQQTFDATDWGNNGPGVISRVLFEICKSPSIKLMTRDRCLGFKVFGKEAFYPIGWWNWTYYFDNIHLDETLQLTKNSFAIHVWNSYSRDRILRVDTSTAYGFFAKKYCPKIYRSCGKYF